MNHPMELRGFAFACPRASAITGQGAVLGCDHCQSDVHDLSELTRGEAIALLTRPDLPCVRLTVGLDGRATFRDPAPVAPTHRSETERLAPAKPPRRSSRRVALFGALAGALATGPVAAAPDAAVEETPAEPERASTLMATAAARLAALVADAEADARRAEADARRAARRRSKKKKKTPSDPPPREVHRLLGKPMGIPPPDTAEAALPPLDDIRAWRDRAEALLLAGKSPAEAQAIVQAEWRARRAELGL